MFPFLLSCVEFHADSFAIDFGYLPAPQYRRTNSLPHVHFRCFAIRVHVAECPFRKVKFWLIHFKLVLVRGCWQICKLAASLVRIDVFQMHHEVLTTTCTNIIPTELLFDVVFVVAW